MATKRKFGPFFRIFCPFLINFSLDYILVNALNRIRMSPTEKHLDFIPVMNPTWITLCIDPAPVKVCLLA